MPLPAPFPPGTALLDLVTLLGSRPQAEMHKETMQKAMAAQRKADEEKRKRDAAKEQALRARLDHEKRLTAERNAKKAADAADKIMKAAKLRLTQTKEAKRQFHIRHEAQAQRMETLRQVQVIIGARCSPTPCTPTCSAFSHSLLRSSGSQSTPV